VNTQCWCMEEDLPDIFHFRFSSLNTLSHFLPLRLTAPPPKGKTPSKNEVDGAMKAWLERKRTVMRDEQRKLLEKDKAEEEEKEMKRKEGEAAWKKWQQQKALMQRQKAVSLTRLHESSCFLLCHM
jgi:hypothetical protein